MSSSAVGKKTKTKKRWMNLLRVLISVGVLGILFWRIGLGQTLDVLRQADVRYLLAAFLLFVLSLVIRAYRWFILVRSLDPSFQYEGKADRPRLSTDGVGVGAVGSGSVSFARLLRLYFVGQFFNAFLPSSFGGDVVRALELTQDTDTSAAIGTVLLDRMTGLLVLFVMGLAALPFNAARMEPWLVGLLLVVAGGGLVVGALVLEGRFLRRLTRWLPTTLSLAGQGPLARVYAAVTGCGWPAVTGAFGVSVLFNLINVVINWLCGQAVGASVGLGYFFAVTPLLSVSGLIPSIGGWGVREAMSTALFSPTGTGANVAAALGLALGIVTLAAGLVGGCIYLVEGVRQMITERRGA